MDLENNEVVDSQKIDETSENVEAKAKEAMGAESAKATEQEASKDASRPKRVKASKLGNLEVLKHNSMTALSILKVLSILCVVFAVIFVAVGMILVINNPDVIGVVSKFATLKNKVQSVIDGNIIIKTFAKDGYTGMAFGIYSLAYGLYLVVLLILLSLMTKVFKTFYAETTPFNKRTIRCLKAVFVVITISALFLNVFFGIFTGFVLWCVIKIFRYGVELQMAADKEV